MPTTILTRLLLSYFKRRRLEYNDAFLETIESVHGNCFVHTHDTFTSTNTCISKYINSGKNNYADTSTSLTFFCQKNGKKIV